MYAGMHCQERSFTHPHLPLAPKHATLAVPFFGQNDADDLTFAILYKYVARSYYPLALLLWREKIRTAPQVTAARPPPIGLLRWRRVAIAEKVQ